MFLTTLQIAETKYIIIWNEFLLTYFVQALANTVYLVKLSKHF